MGDNGDEFIKTFRRILEKKEGFPQDVTNELVFAAIVDSRTVIAEARTAIGRCSARIEDIFTEVKEIRENDLVHIEKRVGEIDKRYTENAPLIWLMRFQTRKTLIILGAIALLLLNISAILNFLVSNVPWIRDWLLAALGLPVPPL